MFYHEISVFNLSYWDNFSRKKTFMALLSNIVISIPYLVFLLCITSILLYSYLP